MLILTNPREYLKRKSLLNSIKNKYNIKIESCGEGDGYYKQKTHFSEEGIAVNTNDSKFYEILLHEVGHLLDFRIRRVSDTTSIFYNMKYKTNTVSKKRLSEISLVGIWVGRGTCGNVLKEELVASKTAIRLGKSLGIIVDKESLLNNFRSYSRLFTRNITENKIQMADIDYLATKYLK